MSDVTLIQEVNVQYMPEASFDQVLEEASSQDDRITILVSNISDLSTEDAESIQGRSVIVMDEKEVQEQFKQDRVGDLVKAQKLLEEIQKTPDDFKLYLKRAYLFVFSLSQDDTIDLIIQVRQDLETALKLLQNEIDQSKIFIKLTYFDTNEEVEKPCDAAKELQSYEYMIKSLLVKPLKLEVDICKAKLGFDSRVDEVATEEKQRYYDQVCQESLDLSQVYDQQYFAFFLERLDTVVYADCD